MRNLRLLDVYRGDASSLWGWNGDDTCGFFVVPSPTDKAPMKVIASSEEGWEHVSVSRQNRCPNWPEMEHVKRMFFKDDEVCMQLHVAATDHISLHPHCLHIWRPTNGEKIPLPTKEMVA